MIKTILSTVLALGFASATLATPITGTVNMGGGITLDTSSLATATTASFNNPAAVVTGRSGTYAALGIPLFTTTVDFSGFNLSVGAQAVNNLWSFTAVGRTFTFDLISITSKVVNGANTQLDLAGTGIVSITGVGPAYDDQLANWTFSITDSSGGTSGIFEFGFASSNTSVPDGGMTLILLGTALTAMGLIRRKMA